MGTRHPRPLWIISAAVWSTILFYRVACAQTATLWSDGHTEYSASWTVETNHLTLGYSHRMHHMLNQDSWPIEHEISPSASVRMVTSKGTAALGWLHESNGRGGWDSRGWDRAYLDLDDGFLAIRTWIAFPVPVTNPQILRRAIAGSWGLTATAHLKRGNASLLVETGRREFQATATVKLTQSVSISIERVDTEELRGPQHLWGLSVTLSQ